MVTEDMFNSVSRFIDAMTRRVENGGELGQDSISTVARLWFNYQLDRHCSKTLYIGTRTVFNDAVIEGGAPLRESAQSMHRYH